MNLDLISFFQEKKTLPRIKDGAYFINLDYKNSKETHWVSLFIDKNVAILWFFWNIFL